MEIKASNLVVGHVLPNGSWGNYRITKIERKDGWVIATGTQGRDSTYVFRFQDDQMTWLA